MSGYWLRYWLAVALVAGVGVRCNVAPAPVVIGLTSAPGVARLAEAALAASRGRGDPAIAVRMRVEGTLPRAVGVAQGFAADDAVIGVVGPSGSGDALLTAPIYAQAGIPQVLPTANAPELDDVGAWTFMLAPSIQSEADFIVDLVRPQTAAGPVLVFFVADPYGRAMGQAIATALQDAGHEVVDRTPVPDRMPCERGPNEAGLAAQVRAALARRRFDAVIVAARDAEAGCVISTMRAEGHAVPVILTDGAPLALTLEQVTGDPGVVIAVTFWDAGQSERSRAFAAAFRQATGTPPNVAHALSYDAVMLLGTAVQEAGPDRAAIRRWLERLGRDREPYQGITGPISFPISAENRLHVESTISGRSAHP